MKLIDVDTLREWLKSIPLKDLSDGKGLCRVIMEDDFKRAIKNMPEECIVDAVPVVRRKDCIYADNEPTRDGLLWCNAMQSAMLDCEYCSHGGRK